jgi:pSer/pThr/pTyr-binding forkhead associated (FHA) protein
MLGFLEILVLLGVIAVIGLIVVFVVRANDKGSGQTRSRPARSPGSARSRGQKFNWLIGKSGAVEAKTFHVGERTATIGRGLGNFIQIGDEHASQVHAQFRGAKSGMQIKDMGSSNGTYLNGEKLQAEIFQPLNDGDEIKIGDTALVYRKVGNFTDQALTGAKNVQASQQKKTQALGAIGGGGDFKEQIRAAVKEAGGDYEKAAQKLGLEADIVETIVAADAEE